MPVWTGERERHEVPLLLMSYWKLLTAMGKSQFPLGVCHWILLLQWMAPHLGKPWQHQLASVGYEEEEEDVEIRRERLDGGNMCCGCLGRLEMEEWDMDQD